MIKIIFILILIILIIYSINIKDTFISFFNIFNNKEIIYSDNLTKEYINYLETTIKEYDNIKSLTDCKIAKVLYRNPIYWYDSFVINISNVNINDLVINNNGVVGYISSVNNNSSTVTLITNTNELTTLKVGNSYGLLSSYDKVNNKLIVTELIKNEVGSVLTTSFTNKYKEGLLIGTVDYSYLSNDNLSYVSVITPVVDYTSINYVCVL